MSAYIKYLLKIVALVFMLPLSTAYAVDKYWVCGDGSWDNPACWSLTQGGLGGAGMPGSGDNALLHFMDNLDRNILYGDSFAPASSPLASILINNEGQGLPELIIHSGRLEDNGVQVGPSAMGQVTQEGGAHIIQGALSLGGYPGGVGTYVINNGELTADTIQIADGGKGDFHQNGGSISANYLIMGSGYWFYSGDAEYQLNNGTLVTNYERVSGDFIQSGGTHTAENMGVYYGRYTLNDGDLNTGARGVLIGVTLEYPASGAFVQNGGNHIATGQILIAAGNEGEGTSGSYTMNGGYLSAPTMTISQAFSLGTFTHNDGDSIINTLNIGDYASTGNYIFNNGALNTDNVVVGAVYFGVGNFEQMGGIHTVSDKLIIKKLENEYGAEYMPESGVYSIAGGALHANEIINNDLLEVNGGSITTAYFTNSADAVMQVGLSTPPLAGGFEGIKSSETAKLSGTLGITLLNNYEPALGDSYEIITASSIEGRFDNFFAPSPANGLYFDVMYGSYNVNVIVVSEPPMPILFEDHFDDASSLANWYSIKPSQWIQGGWLYTQDTGPGRDSFAVTHDSDPTWTDYTINMIVDPVLSMGGQVENAEILFRTQDLQWTTFALGGSYYRLSMQGPAHVNGQSLSLRRFMSDTSFVELYQSTTFPISSDPMRLTITMKGPMIKVWIDGVLAIDVEDYDPLLYGGLAIGAIWESVARYDDIVVMSIDSMQSRFQPTLLSLGDINANGSQDVAALVHDAAASTLIATVKDAENNSLISTVAFNGSLTPLRFIQLPDINSNGAPELVVLGTGSVKAEVRDSLTGNLLSTVNFNPNITPVDIGVVPDRNGNGIPELAVLGKHPTKGFVNVQTRDALTGNKIASTGFVPSFIPKQLLVLPDVDGNGMPEFAVLAVEDSADQFIKVEIRNFNGAPVRDIWLDQVSPDPLYMAMLDDMNGNGAVELATLRQKKDWVNVVVNDALSGAKLSSIGYNPNFAPLKLVVMPDLNGNGKQELAVFGKNINTDGIKAEVRDASSGALVKDVWFWKVFTPQDLVTTPDISGNGKAELAMLGLRLSDGALRAYIKDVVTNTDIINVRF